MFWHQFFPRVNKNSFCDDFVTFRYMWKRKYPQKPVLKENTVIWGHFWSKKVEQGHFRLKRVENDQKRVGKY